MSQQVRNLQQEASLFEGSDVVQEQVVGNPIDGHRQGQLPADDDGKDADPDGDDGQGDEEGCADATHNVRPAALAVHEPPKQVELGLQQRAHFGVEHDLEVPLHCPQLSATLLEVIRAAE